MQVSVRDLMARQPATVNQHTSLAEASRLILDRALAEVYVIDDLGRLLGTVSDYELLKASIMRSDAGQPVMRIMSRSLLVLRPETPFEEVAGLFRESCHARLPVVENGRVVGQLCRRDVLRTLLLLESMSSDSRPTDDSTEHVRVESAEARIPPGAHLSAETADESALAAVRS